MTERDSIPPSASPLARVPCLLAVAGGLVILASALLVTASVIGRWKFNTPIPADYELVEICVGVSVFAFLTYAQMRGGHIMVETFTEKLPPRVNTILDGLWNLVLAGFLGFFSWGLVSGGLDALADHQTLVQLRWPIWPIYMLCAALCAVAALVALATVFFGYDRRP